MTERVEIRPARPEDAETIGAIWYRGWCDAHLGNVPDALLAVRTPESFTVRAVQRLAAPAVGGSAVAVALVSGTVAGFVMVTDDEVEQVYLADSHRGSGVAAELLAEAERLVAAGGHRLAWLAVVAGNLRARRFYARNGWEDTGMFDHHAPSDQGPVPVPAHRYVKRLD